jgi:hypothetical protein
MLSSDEFDHSRFEELCALAPIGEISAEELQELRSHLAVCAQCRIAHEEYGDIVGSTFPKPSDLGEFDSLPVSVVEPDNGERERFFAEARRRGFRISHRAEHGSEAIKTRQTAKQRPFATTESWFRAALAAMVLLVAGAGVFGGYQLGKARYPLIPGQGAQPRLNNETGEPIARSLPGETLVNPGSPTAPAKSQFELAAAERPENAGVIAQLETELKNAQDEKSTLLAGFKSLEDQLQAAASEIQALKAQVEAEKASAQTLAGKLAESERNQAQLSAELRNVSDARNHDANTIAAGEARIKELSEMFRAESEKLERERGLPRGDRDIRDLVTARNLHIIDVHEVDGNGRTRRTFGRAFYTEGKSLILYAYDPNAKRGNSEYALQGWGTRGAASNIAHSLGVFNVDDQKDNRWVLKFDNPHVLAEIDSVFVTIEPPGGSKKPTGEKLLYAYLKGSPNHP